MGSRRVDKPAIDEVFGDELPRESSDEREPDAAAAADSRDRWLRDNVPPHHI